MTEKEIVVVQNTPSVPNEKQKKPKKDSFTKLQSLFLILLTLCLSVGGWYFVGKTYVWNNLDMKRVQAQLEYQKQKVQAEPSNPKNRVDLGYTYHLIGKNAEAIKEFNQVIALDPKSFDGYYNLGVVLSEEKRYNEALDKFQKGIELAPKDYKVHLQKGIAYRNLKMYSEAAKELRQADTLLPGNADVIYETGRVAEDLGNKDSAIQIYKEALSYDPLYKDAAKALARLEKK